MQRIINFFILINSRTHRKKKRKERGVRSNYEDIFQIFMSLEH